MGALSDDSEIALLSSQTGLSLEVLEELRDKLRRELGSLPNSVPDWTVWTLVWLMNSDVARAALLAESYDGFRLATSLKNESQEVTSEMIAHIWRALELWMAGSTIAEIEGSLGGQPTSKVDTYRLCPRAREFVATVAGRAISYAASVVVLVCQTLKLEETEPGHSAETLQSFPIAVRRGFDRHQKIRFAQLHPDILSRVQVHVAFRAAENELWPDEG
jgi:hypothetical protein